MLITAVFVLPVIMEISGHGVLLFNILLLSVFFSGIFSTRSVGLISVSAILFSIHLALRLRLLFRDQSVNTYRIVGAVNVYLLLALMGALTLEVIHAATGVSIGGNVVMSGKDDDYVHLIYFSLASLTTVSFGDIYVCQHFRQDAGHFFVHSGHPVSGHNHRPPGWTGFQPAFLITQLRRTGKRRGWA